VRGIESIAGTPPEQAEDRGATTRRLLSELGPYLKGLILALGLVALGALAQAGGPWLIGRAIDQDILGRDLAGLFRTMVLLLTVYAADTLAQRGQIRQIGATGQGMLASLRARIFERLQHVPLGYFDRAAPLAI
jgi:ATP-binding cassette, subfamily B, multidrug efflux pump